MAWSRSDPSRGKGIDAELQVAVGDPADAIVDLAKESGADLIVFGSRELGHPARSEGTPP